jgi:hypothetical protein
MTIPWYLSPLRPTPEVAAAGRMCTEKPHKEEIDARDPMANHALRASTVPSDLFGHYRHNLCDEPTQSIVAFATMQSLSITGGTLLDASHLLRSTEVGGD